MERVRLERTLPDFQSGALTISATAPNQYWNNYKSVISDFLWDSNTGIKFEIFALNHLIKKVIEVTLIDTKYCVEARGVEPRPSDFQSDARKTIVNNRLRYTSIIN